MASGLPTLVYYGPNRYKHLSGLERHDIVITTYNVVASEWKNRKGSSAEKHANGLLGLIWHRIVLDEGMRPFCHPPKSSDARCSHNS